MPLCNQIALDMRQETGSTIISGTVVSYSKALRDVCVSYFNGHPVKLGGPVEHRDAAALMPLVWQYILPGTTMMSDKWAAYNGIQNLPKGVGHKERNGTLRTLLDSYLAQFMWKKLLEEDPLHHIADVDFSVQSNFWKFLLTMDAIAKFELLLYLQSTQISSSRSAGDWSCCMSASRATVCSLISASSCRVLLANTLLGLVVPSPRQWAGFLQKPCPAGRRKKWSRQSKQAPKLSPPQPDACNMVP
ncbi:unnamed protein product [Enterobius vermicularis]|uniref:DDE_Tnp_IS1595 domain-containing protein n=1 Tax=Enterobius vermicularis TaxID=51028 RepID=A0A0N4VIB5_ENTVE|nr:unnamed protein product [Enterobius vermicularis]